MVIVDLVIYSVFHLSLRYDTRSSTSQFINRYPCKANYCKHFAFDLRKLRPWT